MPGCQRFRPDLSPFVDGTLSQRRFEQVGYHVAGCESCRREVQSLREVRGALSVSGQAVPDVPADLASRLQRIAGTEANSPLYLASGTSQGLPRRRHYLGRALLGGGLLTFGALASLVFLALLVAPDPPRIDDAVQLAKQQHFQAMAATSVDEPVGAALLASELFPDVWTLDRYVPRKGVLGRAESVEFAEVTDLLSQTFTQSVAYAGTQRVWIADERGFFYADVEISKVPDEGVQLQVMSTEGDASSAWLINSPKWDFAGIPTTWNYRLYDCLEQVAGRWAKIVEAYDDQQRPIARWWLDDANGLLLWSEHYNHDGYPVVASGFIELELGGRRLEPFTGLEIAMQPVSASGTHDWCQGLLACPPELAGLPLVAYSEAGAAGEESMRLVYSDGFRTLSVCWVPGILDSEQLQVIDHSSSQVNVMAWQTSDGVITVATNGRMELLRQASEQLPSPEGYRPDLGEQLWNGLRRLVGVR